MSPEELAEGFLWSGRNFYTKTSIFTRFFHNFTHPLIYFSVNWGIRNGFKNKKVEDFLPHPIEPSLSSWSQAPMEAPGLLG
jgi:hypothetical protein